VGNTISSLLIKLGIDSSGVKSGAESAKGEINKLGSSANMSGLSGSLTGLESRLKSTGTAGNAAGTALGIGMAAVGFSAISMGAEFVSGIFTATAAEDRLIKQTEAVIASTKGAANVGSEWVSTYANQLQGLTGVDDDVIHSAENMLLTFTAVKNGVGAGNDIFNQATQTVLDMSVALGEDGKNAAIQLGKALQDPIAGATALKKVGVALSDGQKEQIKAFVASGDVMSAQKVILRELATEFGGSAKAFGDSAEGMQAKLGNAAADFQKSIGAVIMPVLKVLLQGLTWLFEHTEILMPVLAGIGAIILAVLVPALWGMVTALFAADAAAAPITLVMLAIGAAVAVAVWAFNSFPVVREIVTNVFGVITGIVKGFVGTLLNVAGAIVGIIAAIPSPLQDGAKSAQKTLDGMRASVDAWGTQTAGVADAAGTKVGLGVGLGVADGIDAGAPAVAKETRTLLQIFGTSLAGVGAAFKGAGGDAMLTMAQGITAARKAPLDAFDTLKTLLKTSLTPLAEFARLKGELTSKELARGLKDGRADVKAQALAVLLVTTERLGQLAAAGGPAGKAAMAQLDAGIRSKLPAVAAASLAAKNAALGSLNATATGAAIAGSTAGGAFAGALGQAVTAAMGAASRAYGSTRWGGASAAPSSSAHRGSYAIGAWNIPANELAFLHAGEMVVPAATAGRIRAGTDVLSAGGAGKGGGGVHIENLVVHNPAPEPISSSIAAQMRRVGHLAMAGS
jgi:hypothetical protein